MSNEMTQRLIGTVLAEGVGRDAIHIAVAPTVANVRLYPGQDVGVDGSTVSPHVGIVDPFLKAPVMPGEHFFLFLYPNTITGLRHEWTHPAFDDAPAGKISQTDHAEKSRAWIAQHADHLGLAARVLMANAADWLRDEEHTIQGGSEHWRDTFNPTEFWHHYEIVTGTVVEPDKKRSFYCCSC